MKKQTMTITKEQILKMHKARSTDYVMPKSGFHESKKYDRKRANRNEENCIDWSKRHRQINCCR